MLDSETETLGVTGLPNPSVPSNQLTVIDVIPPELGPTILPPTTVQL